MLPPQGTFFTAVKAKIDASDELKQKWSELAEGDNLAQATQEWTTATAPYKQGVVKDIVPNLIASRVLGFHLDLVNSKATRTMNLRPIIAEAALPASQGVIDQYGCEVLRRQWESVLIELKDGYSGLRSVFDAPEEVA